MSSTADRVAWLRAQRTRPTAVWVEFILAYAKRPSTLFAFVEGKDDASFYLPELRRRWRRGDVYPLPCDGKAGVHAVLERFIAAKGAYRRALFFCDKDLDDLLERDAPEHPRLFTTQFYSAENYVVTEEVFRFAWTDLFKLPASDLRLEVELGRFHEGLRRFHRLCAPLMALVLVHRAAHDRLLLNQLKLSKLFEVDPMLRPRWRSRQRMSALIAMCPEIKPRGTRCLRAAARRFVGREPKVWVRGKFELWFFARALQQCLERLAKDPPGTRPACSIQISEANALEVLCGRGAPPVDIDAFLRRCLTLDEAA